MQRRRPPPSVIHPGRRGEPLSPLPLRVPLLQEGEQSLGGILGSQGDGLSLALPSQGIGETDLESWR